MNLLREFAHLALPMGILGLPLASAVFRLLALQRNTEHRAILWLRHRRTNNVLSLAAVIVWCAFWGLDTVSASPQFLFWLAPIASVVLVQLISRFADRTILERRWTSTDILRLAWWSTVHPAISLLSIATGFLAIFQGEISGIFWLVAAGIVALVGTVRLRSAQRMKLRRVKSGTLYTRALHLAKGVGIKLERVYVVPPGRGDLTNAFASWRSIALTDNFGEYLHGPQLDYVIGHELAHVKSRHTRTKVLVLLVIFTIMAVLLFKLPLAALAYRPLFLLLVLFLPLMTFYFLSRCFEYEADRQAVEFTNNPEAGIRALSALYRMTGAPTECGKFAELFMTHPSLMRRVVAIARLGQIPTVRVSEILVASGLPESLHDATQFQTF